MSCLPCRPLGLCPVLFLSVLPSLHFLLRIVFLLSVSWSFLSFIAPSFLLTLVPLIIPPFYRSLHPSFLSSFFSSLLPSLSSPSSFFPPSVVSPPFLPTSLPPFNLPFNFPFAFPLSFPFPPWPPLHVLLPYFLSSILVHFLLFPSLLSSVHPSLCPSSLVPL